MDQPAQDSVDQLIGYVNEQIELLALEDPDPSLLDRMIQSLSDPRKAARISLIEALGQIGEPATPFVLQGLGQHPEPTVRRSCCNALAQMGDDTAVGALVKALLYDSDISVKSAAAGALAKIGAPAFDALKGVLATEAAGESSKGHAAWAIASMSAEVSEQLYRSVDDASAAVRTAVVGAIAQLAQQQMAQQQMAQQQTVQQHAQQSDPKCSIPALEPPPLALLTQALSDRAADVRIEAAAHLARLNCQAAYAPLVTCLNDANWEVRKAAALAIGKLGRAEGIDAIARLKTDPEPAVQRVATLILEQLAAQ
ncbi:MAG: HEAT repeat domain-containing protein [Cyanobacteria bacterium J06560_2]